jgi:hypothetical protein
MLVSSDQTPPGSSRSILTRRSFLAKAIGVTGALAGTTLVAACGVNPFGASLARAQTTPTKPEGGPPGGPSGNEESSLAEPFVGITTNGAVMPGLFTIAPTGISTAPVRAAAEAFLGSLTAEQRAATTFAVDDAEWRKWSNVDGYRRQGVSLEQMNESQRTAAFDLMAAALSAKGFQLSRDIMRLNTTEGELMNRLDGFNEWLYYVTVMGTPSDTEP